MIFFHRGLDSSTPGGLVDFLNKNTPSHVPAQAVGGDNNGSSSKPISVGEDINDVDCPRTRMLWTKDEDETLVSCCYFLSMCQFKRSNRYA